VVFLPHQTMAVFFPLCIWVTLRSSVLYQRVTRPASGWLSIDSVYPSPPYRFPVSWPSALNVSPLSPPPFLMKFCTTSHQGNIHYPSPSFRVLPGRWLRLFSNVRASPRSNETRTLFCWSFRRMSPQFLFGTPKGTSIFFFSSSS